MEYFIESRSNSAENTTKEETALLNWAINSSNFKNYTTDSKSIPGLPVWWKLLDEKYLRHSFEWTSILIAAYIFIFVTGVIGNIMVILVVSLRPKMRSVTNIFILNLAVADLLVILFCIPATLLSNLFTRKYFLKKL